MEGMGVFLLTMAAIAVATLIMAVGVLFKYSSVARAAAPTWSVPTASRSGAPSVRDERPTCPRLTPNWRRDSTG